MGGLPVPLATACKRENGIIESSGLPAPSHMLGLEYMDTARARGICILCVVKRDVSVETISAVLSNLLRS